MQIPDSVCIMGHEIPIIWSDTLSHDIDALGLADYRNQQIILQRDCVGYPVTRSCTEQAYLHELLHFILVALGETGLNENEILINNIAGLLAQALKER